MDILLHYQVPVSKLIGIITVVTVVSSLSAGALVGLVKLYSSRLRALEAEQELARLHAEEATRQRIAADLHSSIGQSLAVAGSLAATLQHGQPAGSPQQQTLAELQRLLDGSLVDLRQLSQVMHGARLLESGLLTAMRADIDLNRRVNVYFGDMGPRFSEHAGPAISEDTGPLSKCNYS